MVLKFDDIIFSKTFEIQAKGETFDVVVSISDEESKEITEIITELITQGTNSKEVKDIDTILFKDDLPKLKELLIGYNFAKFERIVLEEFQNFILGSIYKSTKKIEKL